jgi:hypothetical protein
MFTFYLSLDCAECDEEIVWGPVATSLTHNGLPVVPYDMAAQTGFTCDECGKRTFTGDLELFTESEV